MMSSNENWVSICQTNDLVDNSGVCALVNGEQVALFKLAQGEQEQVLAISNFDPIGKANVLYRGLICSVSGEDTPLRYVVASPLYKQRFCLTTGECIDDPEQSVSVFPARIVDEMVQLSVAS
jgi:nitrite reductase (NADH) small subunit